jgi:antitoxin MazE
MKSQAAQRRETNSDKEAFASTRSSRIAKWGNSLGVRIPQEAAKQLHLQDGGQVSVEVMKDSLVIRPVRRARKKWTEKELLKGVTPEIVGGEMDWGPPVGKELA